MLASSVIAAFAIGGALGYILTRRRLEEEYLTISKLEIEEARRFYRKLNKEDFPTPEDAVRRFILKNEPTITSDQFVEALRQYTGESIPQSDTIEVKNIFDRGSNTDPEVGYAEEVQTRNREAPYILSLSAFMSNESGYTQVTLTYYAGDNVLTDERDEPIEDVNATIGLENLYRFGDFSGDPRTIYISNERLQMDFEVLRHDGKYTVEVLGLDDRPRSRK